MAITLTIEQVRPQISLRPDSMVGIVGDGNAQTLVLENDLTAMVESRFAYAAAEVVARTAPTPRTTVHDMMLLTLTGYLVDCPPSKVGNAWAASGCAIIGRPLPAPPRHRAGDRMRWPWQHRGEQRAYSDTVVNALLAAAAGGGDADANGDGAVQASCRLLVACDGSGDGVAGDGHRRDRHPRRAL